MEDGIASLGHQFSVCGIAILRIYRKHRVTDDTVREIVFTGIHRRSLPFLGRYIRIFFSFLQRVPPPPSVEVTLTDRQLHTLVGRLCPVGRIVVIDDIPVLMNLLYAVFQIRTGCSFGVNEVLIALILEAAGLHDLYAEVDVSPYLIDLQGISEVYIGGTGRTDTVTLTMHRDRILAYAGDLTPIRCVSVFVYQTDFR